MTPLGVFARGTPGARTPDGGVLRIDGDGRASQSVARALAQLVKRLEEASGAWDDVMLGELGPESAVFVGVREALRHLAGRSREGALLLRVLDGMLVLQGVPMTRESLPVDSALEHLRQRLVSRGVGALTIREGAAPGELLTLGRWLLRLPGEGSVGSTPVLAMGALALVPGDGTSLPAAAFSHESADGVRSELLRTWSILVTPVAEESAVDSDASSTSANAFGRLAAARSDSAATASVALLIDTIDAAEARGDAVTIEHAARACMAQLRLIGGGGGRVAIENAVRRLLQPKTIDLLASRLPYSQDRTELLQLLARGGDVSVSTLLDHLFAAKDGMARRAFFDGIVAMDVSAALLFELLPDPRWYVVRNAAALLGEMGVERADVLLLPLLSHGDERIRIASARALFRLRTAAALAGLHRMVDDPHPEVRRLSAAAYGLSGSIPDRSRPAAGPLSAALDREADEDVALEMLAALGRLGSSHAVQRLLRIALPASPSDRARGEQSTLHQSWLRIAALEALIRARGHAMLPAIESLTSDADPEVAAAATRLYGASRG